MIVALLTKLQTLNDDFSELVKGESEWPPSELPNAKTIYADFYDEINKVAYNIVCGSCACIGHDEKKYHKEPITSDILAPLKVNPDLIPFDFSSRYKVLSEKQIMVDDIKISEGTISFCSLCHHSLTVTKKIPQDSLGNYQ